jgi:hypothetical protein
VLAETPRVATGRDLREARKTESARHRCLYKAATACRMPRGGQKGSLKGLSTRATDPGHRSAGAFPLCTHLS